MRKLLSLLMVSLMVTTAVLAQEPEETTPTPKWISEKGYWIIESNVKTPTTSIIHFYDINNNKIYSEKVEGVQLNLKKRKTLMLLKKALDESLIAYANTKRARQDVDLVKNIFKH